MPKKWQNKWVSRTDRAVTSPPPTQFVPVTSRHSSHQLTRRRAESWVCWMIDCSCLDGMCVAGNFAPTFHVSESRPIKMFCCRSRDRENNFPTSALPGNIDVSQRVSSDAGRFLWSRGSFQPEQSLHTQTLPPDKEPCNTTNNIYYYKNQLYLHCTCHASEN